MAGRDIKTLLKLFEENRTQDDLNARELPRLNLPSMSMSISEFVTLLNEFQRDNTAGSQRSGYDLGEKTVRNYINKILSDCGMSLRENQERFGAFKSKYGSSNFMIGPEFQGLFMTLCDSQYAAGRSINRSIQGRSEYYEKLLSNIHKYLSCDGQNFLRGRMEYRNACTFVEYCKKADKQYAQIKFMLLNCDASAEGLLAQIFAQHIQQCLVEFESVIKTVSKGVPDWIVTAKSEDTEQTTSDTEDPFERCLLKMGTNMNLPNLLLKCIESMALNKPLEPTNDSYINYWKLGRNADPGEVFRKFECNAKKQE